MVAERQGMSKSLHRFSLKWCLAVVAAVIAMIQPTEAQRRAAPVDREVRAAMSRGTTLTRVIVRVRNSDRAAVRSALSKKQRHKVRRELRAISAMSLELPANAIDALTRQHGVEAVSIDAKLTAHQAP